MWMFMFSVMIVYGQASAASLRDSGALQTFGCGTNLHLSGFVFKVNNHVSFCWSQLSVDWVI